jgi:hypothetical protein
MVERGSVMLRRRDKAPAVPKKGGAKKKVNW